MTWVGISPSDDGVKKADPEAVERIEDAVNRIKILIVEDDFLIALDLENRLADAGFEVVGTAVTGGEAMALVQVDKPDIAIMDIRLAGRRDGVDVAVELFSVYGVRSIFASAHADVETQKRGASASPIGWLQKPIAPDDLIGLIHRHFSRH